MLASVLSVILAVVIFFKFDSHRFRSAYAAIVCVIALPIFTAISYAIGTFIADVGVNGFVNESMGLIFEMLLAPFRQMAGHEVLSTVVFPGWLVIAAILATAINLIKTARAPQSQQAR